MKFKLVYTSVNGRDLSGTVSFLEKRYTRWAISSLSLIHSISRGKHCSSKINSKLTVFSFAVQNNEECERGEVCPCMLEGREKKLARLNERNRSVKKGGESSDVV